MRKKKVLLIEDNSRYYELFTRIFSQLPIACFPTTKDKFDSLRSSFSVVLAPQGHYIQEFQDKRVERVRTMLANYIDGTPDEDVLCICDYYLFDNDPDVNGILFYEEFLGDKKPAIFISSTMDRAEIHSIERFCSMATNREFFRKDQRIGCVLSNKKGSDLAEAEFVKILTEKIKAFLES